MKGIYFVILAEINNCTAKLKNILDMWCYYAK